MKEEEIFGIGFQRRLALDEEMEALIGAALVKSRVNWARVRREQPRAVGIGLRFVREVVARIVQGLIVVSLFKESGTVMVFALFVCLCNYRPGHRRWRRVVAKAKVERPSPSSSTRKRSTRPKSFGLPQFRNWDSRYGKGPAVWVHPRWRCAAHSRPSRPQRSRKWRERKVLRRRRKKESDVYQFLLSPFSPLFVRPATKCRWRSTGCLRIRRLEIHRAYVAVEPPCTSQKLYNALYA